MGGGDPGFSQTESQQAHLRLAFLAEASKIFAGSLEIEDALQSLARLAVTFLTDICLIDLLEEALCHRRSDRSSALRGIIHARFSTLRLTWEPRMAGEDWFRFAGLW